jgi:hypothetical protein
MGGKRQTNSSDGKCDICVLGVMLFWGFSFFYWFPNRVIFPFKSRNVFFQRIRSAFIGVWIKFCCLFGYIFFYCLVCEVFARLTWLFSFRLLVS